MEYVRDDLNIRSSDFRRALGLAAPTMSDLCKKQKVTLKGTNKTKFISCEDAKRLLEKRGYKFANQAKIIAVMICKGGTGKSTSTYYLGVRLAAYGNRVLVIDADSQGNLTRAFNLDKYGIELSEETPILVDIYKGDLSVEDAAIQITPNLDLIPSTPLNSVLDREIMSKYKNLSKPMKKALEPVMNSYDYILIDCAPALNITNTTIITAADTVMLPINPDAFSKSSLDQTLSELDKIEEEFDKEIERKIVFTKLDQREFTSLHYLTDINQQHQDKLFNTIIRTSADVKNAITKNEDLFTYTSSTAKEDYDDLTQEIMGLKDSIKRTRKKR